MAAASVRHSRQSLLRLQVGVTGRVLRKSVAEALGPHLRRSDEEVRVLRRRLLVSRPIPDSGRAARSSVLRAVRAVLRAEAARARSRTACRLAAVLAYHVACR
jgi:hypothetical protein